MLTSFFFFSFYFPLRPGCHAQNVTAKQPGSQPFPACFVWASFLPSWSEFSTKRRLSARCGTVG